MNRTQTSTPYSQQELKLVLPFAQRAIRLYEGLSGPHLEAMRGYSGPCAVSCAKLAQDVRAAGERVAQQIIEKIGPIE